jgi:hypothetical protein
MHAYQHGGVPEQKTPIWSAVRLNRAVLILTVVGIVTHFALIRDGLAAFCSDCTGRRGSDF